MLEKVSKISSFLSLSSSHPVCGFYPGKKGGHAASSDGPLAARNAVRCGSIVVIEGLGSFLLSRSHPSQWMLSLHSASSDGRAPIPTKPRTKTVFPKSNFECVN